MHLVPLIIFAVHLASTWFMTGVIWFVQIVHYPLFAVVGAEHFFRYEQLHRALTTWIVAPAMFIEVLSGLLLIWQRPAGISNFSVYLGLALIVLIWWSTAFIQVPAHAQLTEHFDSGVQQRLITTNWLRTLAWSFRGVLCLWMLTTLK